MSQYLGGLFEIHLGRELSVHIGRCVLKTTWGSSKPFSQVCLLRVSRTLWWGGIKYWQETSSLWDNKINALWVSMATGGPSCSSGPACCRMAHLCQVSPCFKTNALSLNFAVPRTAADETWSNSNYSSSVQLAHALMNTAFLMDAVIFLLRRYI